jgi:hypothetical protein
MIFTSTLQRANTGIFCQCRESNSTDVVRRYQSSMSSFRKNNRKNFFVNPPTSYLTAYQCGIDGTDGGTGTPHGISRESTQNGGLSIVRASAMPPICTLRARERRFLILHSSRKRVDIVRYRYSYTIQVVTAVLQVRSSISLPLSED